MAVQQQSHLAKVYRVPSALAAFRDHTVDVSSRRIRCVESSVYESELRDSDLEPQTGTFQEVH